MVSRFTSGARQYNWINVAMVLAMSIASIAVGYSASIIATTLAQPTFIKYFRLDTRSNATALISTMNGLYYAGGAIGVFCVSPLADRYGRKAAISISILITLISGALLAGSVDVGMFIAFRFWNGVGSFMALSAIPVWMSEVTPPKDRGKLVDLHAVGILVGYVSASWIGYGFWWLDHPAAWRAPLAIAELPSVIILAIMHFLPESPRYLLMRDKHDEAAKTLQRLHTPEEAAIELQQIAIQMQADRAMPSSYWDIIKRPSYRKRALMSLSITCGIQFSGVLVINNYGPSLYAKLGYDANDQLLLLCGWLLVALVGGVLSVFVVDHVSRPKIIGAGIFGCMCCLVVEAAIVAVYADTTNKSALAAGVAMFFIYIFIYEVCLDGPQFAYIAEIFPTHIRPKGLDIGVSGLCLMNICWTQAAPTAFKTIGWKFYLCFIIPSLIASTGIFFFFPDTWGVPLEEIAAIFNDPVEVFAENLEPKVAIQAEHLEYKGVNI